MKAELEEQFHATMSSKGQVVIVQPIREKLNLRPNQKFTEEVRKDSIVLRPIPSLVQMGGFLKGMAKGKSTDDLMKEIDEGWDT